jgi:glutamyl-tRNA synthetase
MAADHPRVRFAPAPTGYLHIGGARTALFNWLFARSSGGEMLLRVEDTDRDRSKPELIEAIYDSLRWLGIDWDSEPVHQSDRLEMHTAAVRRLLDEGPAYYCDCPQEEVQRRAKERGGPPGYDGFCRERGVAPGDDVVVRFRTPDEGVTSFDDVVRGEVSFENTNLEDFVVQRSSGRPMFVVANAVDDVDMAITHVIRGEDLINVTPKVLLLREALGSTSRPVFAHLPLIVNEKRKKLSKRRDDVAVGDYRDRGYLPEAMTNYLALLGWGPPDDVEIRPIAEIIDLFDLAAVNKSPAFFDLKKLDHINGEYIRNLGAADFIERSRPFIDAQSWEANAFSVFEELAPVVQQRVHRLDEVPPMIDFVFLDEPEIEPKAWTKIMENFELAGPILDDAILEYGECEWSTDPLHQVTKGIGERHGLKLGKTTGPIRVATTGKSIGPPLFESLEALGRDRTIERLRAARTRLE